MRDPSMDIKGAMLGQIAASPQNIWTPFDFMKIGARAAVDKALQRLVQSGEIRRLDRGFYFRVASNNAAADATHPTLQALIEAISRRDQARLLIDELTAANDLGFTDEVPANIVILSDARLRPVRLGTRQITFRQAAPSKLHWAGRPAMHIVQALYWMHDAIVAGKADAAARRLRNILSDPDRGHGLRSDLRDGLPALPIWMQTFVREILAEADPMAKLPLGRPARR